MARGVFAGRLQTSRKPADPRRSCGVHAKSSSTERVPSSSCFGEAELGRRHASGVRWVAVRVVSHAALIISAHLPHARHSVMSFRETLQEITCCLERFKSAFPRHHVVLGADCNVSLNGFVNFRFVGDATVPLTKVRSCADAERASALYEFMLNFGLRADNTWSGIA